MLMLRWWPRLPRQDHPQISQMGMKIHEEQRKNSKDHAFPSRH